MNFKKIILSAIVLTSIQVSNASGNLKIDMSDYSSHTAPLQFEIQNFTAYTDAKVYDSHGDVIDYREKLPLAMFQDKNYVTELKGFLRNNTDKAMTGHQIFIQDTYTTEVMMCQVKQSTDIYNPDLLDCKGTDLLIYNITRDINGDLVLKISDVVVE